MLLFAWFVFSVLVGAHAYRNYRNAGVWFIISMLISPALAFCILYAITGDSKTTP